MGSALLQPPGSGVDWTVVVEEAERHGILPLVERSLRAIDIVPAATKVDLQGRARATALVNVQLAAALIEVLDGLAAAGIAALTYKGPVLAESVYGDLALRRFVDVDVLVSRRDAQAARRVLEDAGYRLPSPPPAGREDAFVRRADEFVLVREDRPGSVDLQWAVTPRPFAFDLDTEALLARAVTARVGGRDVRTLSDEDSLLVLCVHGSKHLWHRLLWIADVAELIGTRTDMNWPAVLERARSLGALRMLFLGLYLASELLDAPVPIWVVDRMKADGKVPGLAERILRRSFPSVSKAVEDGDEELSFDPLTLRMRERGSDRARYLARNLFVPTVQDWEFVSLPEWADAGYAVLRPIRLIGRYARAAVRRMGRFRP